MHWGTLQLPDATQHEREQHGKSFRTWLSKKGQITHDLHHSIYINKTKKETLYIYLHKYECKYTESRLSGTAYFALKTSEFDHEFEYYISIYSHYFSFWTKNYFLLVPYKSQCRDTQSRANPNGSASHLAFCKPVSALQVLVQIDWKPPPKSIVNLGLPQ